MKYAAKNRIASTIMLINVASRGVAALRWRIVTEVTNVEMIVRGMQML